MRLSTQLQVQHAMFEPALDYVVAKNPVSHLTSLKKGSVVLELR